jgi:hypothetical protein
MLIEIVTLGSYLFSLYPRSHQGYWLQVVKEANGEKRATSKLMQAIGIASNRKTASVF